MVAFHKNVLNELVFYIIDLHYNPLTYGWKTSQYKFKREKWLFLRDTCHI